jgi:riboflavin kinase/FMN adenylyltransferase
MAPFKVWWSLDETPADFGPCSLTIGNFDGVHIGHRVLMHKAADIGEANGWKPSVLTFNPHPARIVAPARAPKMITSFERRAELMAEEKIQQVLVMPFTEEVSHWSPEEFVSRILAEKLQARAVVVGEDFRFGYKQAGDSQTLANLGEKYGFTVSFISPVSFRGVRASSSLVRELVGSGNVARAARLLTEPFALQGRVVTGKGIGSKQTVPTLNLEPDSEVMPRNGVYVTRTTDLGTGVSSGPRWESITNVGVRPTFNGEGVTVESFLLGTLEGETPERIRVEFLRRVRDERKFDSPELLKQQILRDVQRAQRVHARLRNICA